MFEYCTPKDIIPAVKAKLIANSRTTVTIKRFCHFRSHDNLSYTRKKI